MSHRISDQAKTQLLSQLVYFDEEMSAFLDLYFPQQGRERSRVVQLLTDYSSVLERIASDPTEESLRSVVLIGSRIKIKGMDDQVEEDYAIVFPNQADPDKNAISFLSPIGFQLLLAAPKETRTIETPAGDFCVSIEDVNYANAGNPDHHE